MPLDITRLGAQYTLKQWSWRQLLPMNSSNLHLTLNWYPSENRGIGMETGVSYLVQAISHEVQQAPFLRKHKTIRH